MKNEAWTFDRENIRVRLREVAREVWRAKYFLEDWREGIITPIYKKQDKDEIGNYRGVTLTSTAYKIYASILNDRIIRSMEGRKKWEENQAGFRKGRGCQDNISILK